MANIPSTTSADNKGGQFALHVAERAGFDRVVKETRKAVSCYYGGESLYDYITKYSALEEDDKFIWRREKIVHNFENYAQEIAQQYIESLTRAGTIKRETNDKQLDEELSVNYTKWFEEELLPMAIMLPEIYVKICKPVAQHPVTTKADAISQKLLPYAVLVFPHFIRNFAVDNNKSIQWITVKVDEHTYEVWDNINMQTVNDKGEIVEAAKPHGFKSCPFVRVLWRENKSVEGHPKPGHSFMFNVTMKTLAALSWIGMLQESALFHLYPKLVWDEDTKQNVQKQGGMGADVPITEASDPGNPGGKTRYLAMPGTEMEIIERILYERIPASIYRTARLRDRSTDKTQSGVAKMMDMIPEISVLTDLTKFISQADKSILRKLAENWVDGFKEENLTATYPMTFDVKSTAEVMKQVADYTTTVDESSLPQSPTASKLIAKKMTIAVLSDLMDVPPETVKIIEKEIDDAAIENIKPAEPTQPKEPNIAPKSTKIGAPAV